MPPQVNSGSPAAAPNVGGTSSSSSSLLTSSAVFVSSSPTSIFTVAASTSYYATGTAASTSASTSQITLSGQPGGSKSGSSKSGNVSTGTVAGAAVAAAVGGALIAFILTFMFMRSRSKQPRETQRHSEKRQSFGGTKALLKKSSDDLLNSRHAWEKHLPQPADDNSIRLTVKTFLHQIELHVETFYSDAAGPSHVSEEIQTELHKFDSPFLPKPLAVVLPQARSKAALIKHCLAHLIVKNITTEGTPDPSQSFLPLEFVALPNTIARTHSNNSPPAFSQSLSRWRVLSSYLHSVPTSDPTYTTARDSAITGAASAFCNAFAPWSLRTQSHATRLQNLVTIMQSAADAGLMIFAQPAAFRWIWDVDGNVRGGGGGGGGGGGRDIVVTPGLVKVTDDDAKVLGRPQVMVQQVVHGF